LNFSTIDFDFFSFEDPNHESAAVAVESIADAVTHARFVGTDTGNDEVVLMKILQVCKSPGSCLCSVT
jgi:golgi-specific brefeldin A-resistance guanine nucleotide exchange factor 1